MPCPRCARLGAINKTLSRELSRLEGEIERLRATQPRPPGSRPPPPTTTVGHLPRPADPGNGRTFIMPVNRRPITVIATTAQPAPPRHPIEVSLIDRIHAAVCIGHNTQSAIATACGCSRATASRCLADLHAAGKVVRTRATRVLHFHPAP